MFCSDFLVTFMLEAQYNIFFKMCQNYFCHLVNPR